MSDHPIEGRRVPQARSLDTIREVVRCASAVPVSPETVSVKVPLSLRHADYHLAAAATLSFLKETHEGYSINILGRALLDTDPKSAAEAKIFAEAILSSPILTAVAPNLLDRIKTPPIAQLIKTIRASTGLAFSTAEARAQTLLAWRKRILKSLSAEAQLSLAISQQAQATPTLRSISMRNWKSFESADLFIDTLTILIGANASGKSNALDALELLRRIAEGDEFRAALGGASGQQPVRGGVEWATRCGAAHFTLGAVVASADDRYTYHYLVTIETQPEVILVGESLEQRSLRTPDKPGTFLFRTDPPSAKAPGRLVARLYNAKAGTKREATRSNSMLRQFAGTTRRPEIEHGIATVRRALTGVLSLDPVPSRMRQYCALSDSLDQHGANVAGVLAALAPGDKERIERKLSEFAAKLPEPTVEAIWSETVGKFAADAMLYARERWQASTPAVEIDARAMSDGTLRFVAILTALLTRPPGSVLVIEEIDNGFHPSRARLLLETLINVGAERRVDIVVTTHNQALLDAVGPDLVPFLFVAHRQSGNGASALTLLEAFEDLPRLLAGSPLGRAAATGALEQMVRASSKS